MILKGTHCNTKFPTSSTNHRVHAPNYDSLQPQRLHRLTINFFEVGQQAVALVGEVADAQERPDARGEFEAVNGLGQEVVCAGLDRAFDVAEFVVAVTIRIGMSFVALSARSRLQTS